jgi:class 3 adenylate cyclase/predicted ATPase
MFCDLVGSTALSTQLDPEDLREVIQAYRETCATVIRRFDGYLAKYIGDGLLVYFGYPVAHEDDAQRAVRVGLEIIQALQNWRPSPLVGGPPFSPSPFQGEGSTSSAGEGSGVAQSQDSPHPSPLPQGARELQVRIGIHTGLVVAGEMGVGDQSEPLGIIGETPNIAARIQGLAEPNTVILSAATHRLVGDHFECQPFGSHLVKGIATPVAVYHVQSERQNLSPLASRTTLTPLVGREQEVGLLVDRWEQVKEGRGQVVLLSGEPGIGKSRLAYTLQEQVTAEGSLLFESRCSPYHQHSALYPLIDVVQRTLLLTRQETDEEKSAKLERALALYGMQETLPLFTALLSLPPPPQYPPLQLTPQKQKERTLQAMLQWLMAQAERHATVSVWEDLHWADPSSLEFLTLLRTGEFAACQEHLEQGIALYNPQQHRSLVFLYGLDPGVGCRNVASASLWYLGYPDQALKRTQEALTLAHELSHPFSLGHTLLFAAVLHLSRREGQLAQERAEAAMALAIEQGFAFWLAGGTFFRGSALAEQGQEEEGITQIRQGLDAAQATGAQIALPRILATLAEAHGKVGQVAEGFNLLDEATAVMRKTEERQYEAELYRLKGELTLQQSMASLGQVQDKSQTSQNKSEVPNPQSLTPNPQTEAEECFLKAIEVARKQQAKSLELRAAMSLARLWQQQGKKAEARHLLADIYGWFTEGFDTKDLQDARALLDELS